MTNHRIAAKEAARLGTNLICKFIVGYEPLPDLREVKRSHRRIPHRNTAGHPKSFEARVHF